jgi:hypothetical protein
MDLTDFPTSPPSDLSQIDKAHRVLNIGWYNPLVSSCWYCYSTDRIDNLGEHCLGFGVPDHPSQSRGKSLAVVYECPKCFERQWSHTRFLKRNRDILKTF